VDEHYNPYKWVYGQRGSGVDVSFCDPESCHSQDYNSITIVPISILSCQVNNIYLL